MLKFNKIMLTSLVSAFGFALFSSAGNSANAKNNSGYTSVALATKFSGNKSETDSAGFTSLHTKTVPTDVRKTLKKSDGSYYKATKNSIKFDDEKHGYHGYISKIKKVKYKTIDGHNLYYFINKDGTTLGVGNTKNLTVLIYSVGKKDYRVAFNK